MGVGHSIGLGMRIGNPHFWAKKRHRSRDLGCDGVGNQRFWVKNGGASINYLRFSIYDWVETLIFGRKTRVKPSIMSAMGLGIGVIGRKNGVR